ncbi:MAG: pantetheine-phosphate adenylyltransferase [Candidatus Saccharimonadales bacterium]
MSTAIYAGSFDPITIGHLSIIEQASVGFDKVIILIADNPEKPDAMFTFAERKDMIERAVAHLPNVKVEVLKGGYTVHYAERVGATTIVRGLRDEDEFKKERDEFFTFNNYENPQISTVFLMSPPSIAHISSSFVKQNCYGISGWLEVVDKYVPPATKDYLMLHYFRKIYKRHLGDLGPSHLLYQAYDNSYRHYHGIAHIVNMYDELRDFYRYEPDLDINSQQFKIIALATLFHDYCIESDPMPSISSPSDKKTNPVEHFGHEAQQASVDEFMHNFAEFCGFGAISGKVKELILATTHTSDKGHPEEAKPLIDADIAILGQSPAVYGTYALGVRKEYSHVSDADFVAGRIKFLKKFLARKHIFCTEFFRSKYEARARENLTRELSTLQNG